MIAGVIVVGGILGIAGREIANGQSVSPYTPTGLTGSFTPPTQISLSWSAPATTTDISGYYIYRNGINVGNTGGTSYADTIPVARQSSTYTYDVAAYGPGGGAFPQSMSISVTASPDVTPPTSPVLSVSGITSSSITISWSASSDSFGITGYYVIKDGINLPMGSSPLTATTYTDTYLNPNATHTYKVIAYDQGGNESAPSNMVTATTFPSWFLVSPPFGLTATAVSAGEIDLAWNGSSVASGTPSYNIYRNGINIASTSNTSYDDTGLSAGTDYDYYVVGLDGIGDFSVQSNDAATSTFGAPAGTSAVNTTNTSTVTATSQYVPSIEPTIILGPQGPITVLSAPTSSSSVSPSPSATPSLTTTLYLGLRGTAVTTLQNILIAQGDLGANYATGYFGALTQKAVQQFQCAENIVCSGSPWTTGWGLTGPKTRAALNAL